MTSPQLKFSLGLERLHGLLVNADPSGSILPGGLIEFPD